MIYRIGAQYMATDRLDVRLGLYYDQSPIRKNNYNPETPGMGKIGISTGCSFEPYRNLQIDFAFLYIQGVSRHGSYPDKYSPGGKFSGKYECRFCFFGFGLSFLRIELTSPKAIRNQLIRIAFFMRPLYTYLHLNVHLV